MLVLAGALFVATIVVYVNRRAIEIAIDEVRMRHRRK